MVDFPGVPEKMCTWDHVERVDAAKETLKNLSQHAKIYIATGASESTEFEIKAAFSRVGLDHYITGYFCKANVGLLKGTKEFLLAILSSLKIQKESVAMIGDSFEKDIVPSAAIGMRSYWLSNSREIELPVGCTQISFLTDLRIEQAPSKDDHYEEQILAN